MSKRAKVLGPKWPRKLKREALGRALFAQAMRAEYDAFARAWADELALYRPLAAPEPVLPYQIPYERLWYFQPTKPQFVLRMTLPVA